MIGNDGIWQRLYFSVQFGALGDTPDSLFNGIVSFRPYHNSALIGGPDYDDSNSVDTDNDFFSRSGITPPPAGVAPEAPWTQPGQSGAGSSQIYSIAFVGSRRQFFAVVPQFAPVAVPRQTLYRCDQWGSTTNLIKFRWDSAIRSDSDNYRATQLVHWSSGTNEGLAALSVSDMRDSSEIRFFDFSGVEFPGANRPSFRFRSGFPHATTSQDILYICRGDSVAAANGHLFGIIQTFEYSGGSDPTPNRVRYEIHNFARSGGTLLTSSAWTDFTTGTAFVDRFWGQPFFDFDNRRLLWTEMVVDRSDGDIVPSRSGLKQLTLNVPAGAWSPGNTTMSDVTGFDFPLDVETTDDPDPDFQFDSPLLIPKAVWTNGLDGRTYVSFNRQIDGTAEGGTPLADILPYAGIVAFNADGANPQMVSRKSLRDYADGDQFWGRHTCAVSLGWNCRANWEL